MLAPIIAESRNKHTPMYFLIASLLIGMAGSILIKKVENIKEVKPVEKEEEEDEDLGPGKDQIFNTSIV
jgi:F0F1-type ATP synthase assembly protein I